jgi:transposase-like protein
VESFQKTQRRRELFCNKWQREKPAAMKHCRNEKEGSLPLGAFPITGNSK